MSSIIVTTESDQREKASKFIQQVAATAVFRLRHNGDPSRE
jgi:hypothetical protein